MVLKGGFSELQEKKEIDIEWEGKPAKIVIRKIDRAIYREVRGQSQKERVIGKSIQTDINGELFRDMMITRAVASAPWKVGIIEEVGRLPPRFVDELFVLVMEFNELGEEKKAS